MDTEVRALRGPPDKTAEGTGRATQVPSGGHEVHVNKNLPVNRGNVILEQGLLETQGHPAVGYRASAVGEPQDCSMKTQCPPPRLVVPASPRGSPCSPKTRKTCPWSPKFSPLCMHALSALDKPRLSNLGLEHGDLATRNPVMLGGHHGLAMHRRQGRKQYETTQDKDQANEQGELRGPRGYRNRDVPGSKK